MPLFWQLHQKSDPQPRYLSVIDNVLFEPLPYTDSHRLFGIQIHDGTDGGQPVRNFFSVPEFPDYQEQNRIF